MEGDKALVNIGLLFRDGDNFKTSKDLNNPISRQVRHQVMDILRSRHYRNYEITTRDVLLEL